MGDFALSGYAPLFSSLTTGTLCGKWPDIGLWPIVLSLKDKHGVVDVTPDYLSRVTGLELDAVVACMARFCEPDPYSRSSALDGRRLVLIDPKSRSWGWRVVNSGLYRERARLQSRDEARTESGEDAERKRKERASRESEMPQPTSVSPDVPMRPPKSPEVPLSDAETKAEAKKTTSLRSVAGRAPKSRFVPETFEITEAMREWAKAECPDVDVDTETRKFRDHEFRDPHTDWQRAWRRWMRNSIDFRRNPPPREPKPAVTWRPPPDEETVNARG